MEENRERSIPIIDLQNFPTEYKKLREACEEWGCFRIVNHNIPLSMMSEMMKVARSLLDLPQEIKRRNTGFLGFGYRPPIQVNPLSESLNFYDIASSQAIHAFSSQLDASPHQSEIINIYSQAIHELVMDIAQKLAQSMGLTGNVFEGWPCLLRLNKYNFTSETIGFSGLDLHTDSGFLTILQDDENVGGLEVMDKSGAFVTVDPLPGTLLVNIGDTAKLWSNGRLYNVKHRVQCKEAAIRMSVVSFLLPPKDISIEAPTDFVDSQHPRLYIPITYADYRQIRNSKWLMAGEALEFVRLHPRINS